MRTPLLAVLVFFVSVAAALAALPKQGPGVSLTVAPKRTGLGVDVRTSTTRPLVVLVDGRRVARSTTSRLHVVVPFRFVRLSRSRVEVRDARTTRVLAGTVASTPRALAVSDASPRLTLTSVPPTGTTARTAAVAWRTNGVRTNCALDGGRPVACRSPFTASGLKVGSHTLVVTVFLHNSSSSVTASWRVAAPAKPMEAASTPTPAPVTRTPTSAPAAAAAAAPSTQASSDGSWALQGVQSPATALTNLSGLGLNVNNQQGGSYSDYAIDGTGDSGVLLQGTTTGVNLSRIRLTRVAVTSAVSWAKHGMYIKARGNSFSDIYAEQGGYAASGISVRMGNNTFTRTVIKGFPLAVTYYEHDGNTGTVTFKDGDWTFTGDTAVWGDDSNEPPTPYIKQAFLFDNIAVHGPAGAKFLSFGSSYGGTGLAYQGAGVTIRNCTINGRPVTAADVAGVPSDLLTIE